MNSKRWPLWLGLAVLLLALLACQFGASSPTATPAPVASTPTELTPTEAIAPTDEPAADVGQGVRLDVPAAIGSVAGVQVIPASDTPAEGPAFNNYPDHREVTFNGYPLTDVFHTPRIELYPVDATMAMNTAASDVIGQVQAMLADRPTDFADPMPFLPIFNAGQAMHVKEAYLDGPGVQGVRYLTQYGQAAYPINNHDLFYTFQGLTADGSFYVVAILPVSHPGLAATGDELPGGDYQDFIDNYDTYLQQSVDMLRAADGGEFTPTLSALDDMIASLQVE